MEVKTKNGLSTSHFHFCKLILQAQSTLRVKTRFTSHTCLKIAHYKSQTKDNSIQSYSDNKTNLFQNNIAAAIFIKTRCKYLPNIFCHNLVQTYLEPDLLGKIQLVPQLPLRGHCNLSEIIKTQENVRGESDL